VRLASQSGQPRRISTVDFGSQREQLSGEDAIVVRKRAGKTRQGLLCSRCDLASAELVEQLDKTCGYVRRGLMSGGFGDWEGKESSRMPHTIILLPKDLGQRNGGFDALFPCITLKCKKHVFPRLRYRRKLEEVTRNNKL
jgi:hypothetical protein